MWNTKIIDFIRTELYGSDAIFKETPFYRGDCNLRKANLEFGLTEEERGNVLLVGDGPQNLRYFSGYDLRDYQLEFLGRVKPGMRELVLKSRQTGFTSLAAYLALWECLTGHGRTFLYLGANSDSAANFVDRVKALYAELPFYMKPGIVSWNAKSVEFDNGCRVVAKGMHGEVMVGHRVDFLWMDEPAFAAKAQSAYRLVSQSLSDDGKIVACSSPNGLEWFYSMVSGADNGTNEFGVTRVRWSQVPGRDAGWKAAEVRNIGQDRFDEENELVFKAPVRCDEQVVVTGEDVGQMLGTTDRERVMAEIAKLDRRLSELKKIVNGGK